MTLNDFEFEQELNDAPNKKSYYVSNYYKAPIATSLKTSEQNKIIEIAQKHFVSYLEEHYEVSIHSSNISISWGSSTNLKLSAAIGSIDRPAEPASKPRKLLDNVTFVKSKVKPIS